MNFCTRFSFVFTALLLVFSTQLFGQSKSKTQRRVRPDAELKSPSDYLNLFSPPTPEPRRDEVPASKKTAAQTTPKSPSDYLTVSVPILPSPTRHEVPADKTAPVETPQMTPADYVKFLMEPDSKTSKGKTPGNKKALAEKAQTPQNQPVEQLVDFQFSARQTESFDVELTWVDSGEDLADNFIVLRRQGQGAWVTVGGLRATNSDSGADVYVFHDPNPPVGKVEYWLKRVGFDKTVRAGKLAWVEVKKF